jgi:hypothetical protein
MRRQYDLNDGRTFYQNLDPCTDSVDQIEGFADRIVEDVLNSIVSLALAQSAEVQNGNVLISRWLEVLNASRWIEPCSQCFMPIENLSRRNS